MRRGVVLLAVMIILLTMSVIGISLVAFFSAVNMSAQTVVDEAKAFYLAEAGVAQAISNLQGAGEEEPQAESDSDTGADGMNIAPTQLGDGTYEVLVDANTCLITAEGKVHGITKKMQLRYGAF
jgi:Tfp pilus assembly protein PilX